MTDTTIRVILIDPFAKTVEYADMLNDFDTMKRDYLRCELADAVAVGRGITAWIDDEGLLKPWAEQGFSRLGADRILAGRIVITGISAEGDMTSLPSWIDLDTVREKITFIDPREVRVPTPTFTSFDADGSSKTERLADTDEWTFDNQPR